MNSELIFWSYNLRLRKKKWVREGHFSRPFFRLNASQGLYETHENWLAKVAVLGRTINRVCGCRNSAATVFTGQLNMSHRAEDADHFNYGQFLHIKRGSAFVSAWPPLNASNWPNYWTDRVRWGQISLWPPLKGTLSLTCWRGGLLWIVQSSSIPYLFTLKKKKRFAGNALIVPWIFFSNGRPFPKWFAHLFLSIDIDIVQ